MKKHLVRVLIVALAFAILPFVPGDPVNTRIAANDGTVPYDDFPGYDSLTITGTFCYSKAFEVLDIVNAERAKKGLRPLRMDAELMEAAMIRAAETTVLFSHTRPNGDICFSIVNKYYRYKMLAENIAYGSSTAEGTMNQWMNSPGHRANIMDGESASNNHGYTSIGIGCFEYAGRFYWSQAFGNDNLSQDCPKPKDDVKDVVLALPGRNYISDNNQVINYEFDPLVWLDDGNNAFFYAVGQEPILINVADRTTLGLGLSGILFKPESVHWTSANPSIAKIDGIYVIGISTGTTTVTAKSSAGTSRANANIKVIDFQRVFGKDRYETSIAAADYLISQQRTEGRSAKFDTVVLASGGNFADALSGTYLAGITDAPILLINKKTEDKVVNYIKQNLRAGGKAYILGGTAAVAQTAENKLKAAGFNVERLGGKDRYGTNLAILEECQNIKGALGVDGTARYTTHMVCSGTSFADSLSAASCGHPIMLVGKTLTQDQKKFISDRGIAFDIIGGTFAVSQAVESELKGRGPVQRLGGKDRFETSALVAEHYFDKPDSAVLVYSQNFPDGLSGGPVGISLGAPILLVNNNNFSRAADYCKSHQIRKVVALGGESVISDEVGVRCAAW